MNIEPEPYNQPKYKTRAEAATAIDALSEEEHVGLLKAARFYWVDRGLNDRYGSAEELLGEAILRTLKELGFQPQVA